MISLIAALLIIAGVTAFRVAKKVPVEDIHGAEAIRCEPHQGDAPLPE